MKPKTWQRCKFQHHCGGGIYDRSVIFPSAFLNEANWEKILLEICQERDAYAFADDFIQILEISEAVSYDEIGHNQEFR